MRKAGAVVIGVNTTGGFDSLKSPARGAEKVANWLKENDFDVELLTDELAPVTAHDIKKAIAKFVTKPPTYEFLLIYFSGHGQWHTRTDHWLLSGAPDATDEAINLEGAMFTARKCGIANVVFISDACRTNPTGPRDSLVSGIDAFPNYGISPASKIDYFKATSEARPAYEIPLGDGAESVLTRAILSVFEEPEPHVVKKVDEGSRQVDVVPNRLLESVLQVRVDALLDGINGSPTQDLDTNVPSADTVYIARVRPPPARARAAGPPPPPGAARRGTRGPPPGLGARRRPVRASQGQAAADEIAATLRGAGSQGLPRGVDRREIDARIPDPTADHFETETGFIIRGARVLDAAVSKHSNNHCEVLNAGDARGDAVRVHANDPALSVVVVVEGERSLLLAALHGYIGHVLFDKEGVANISYIPSSNNRRFTEYQQKREELDRLRALVAFAVQSNTFRVRSEEEAVQLAERIRVSKALDPALGIYAAYAFAQAGMDPQVQDVQMYMRDDLSGASIFDVAMLANQVQHRNIPLAPPCPMLTQGWNLLRAYDVKLPDVLVDASRFLSNALWTTFTGRGTRLIFDAIKHGEFK